MSTTESSMSGLATCDQDVIDASAASAFVVSRDIKHAPLRVSQDLAVPYHYCKHLCVSGATCNVLTEMNVAVKTVKCECVYTQCFNDCLSWKLC